MSKKCNCPPVGAPEWVVTYGDMMSLLLTFFILLAALSEIKKNDEYKAIVEEMQRAFGMLGGGGGFTVDATTDGLIQGLDELNMINLSNENRSNTTDPGVEGKEAEVTRIREGMLITQGGVIAFEPGSAELNDTAKAQLNKMAQIVRGYNNKIEIRGHAAAMEIKGESGPQDLWQLSYQRAKAAMLYLTSPEVGVPAARLRLSANADQEPLAKRVYSEAGQQPNRRVEIVVMEALAEEFNKPEVIPSD